MIGGANLFLGKVRCWAIGGAARALWCNGLARRSIFSVRVFTLATASGAASGQQTLMGGVGETCMGAPLA